MDKKDLEVEFRLRHVMSSLRYIDKENLYKSRFVPKKDNSFQEELKKEEEEKRKI